MKPEQNARIRIDALLVAAGWHVCDVDNANIHAGDGAVKGVAIREDTQLCHWHFQSNGEQ